VIGCSGRPGEARVGSLRRRPPYNEIGFVYNTIVSTSKHIMTVSRNGQVSIPAATRARWNARQVIVVDLGDRVVMRPASDEPIADLEGKYKRRGPTADQARRRTRQAEAPRKR
jgi:bifunctional DNA-binding transcriptional regulator/antitoxin component of YhaV-PrlF toxin-antitoxin module